MMFPKILIEIINYLSKQSFSLSKRFDDGRINATINESEILNVIKRKFDIEIPRSRAWYDFSINDENSFYPVNIKTTDTTHADNLNCKLGIYYALTGLLPDFPNEINWLNYFEKLKENIETNKNKDYYFLVVNKNEHTDILESLETKQRNDLESFINGMINILPYTKDNKISTNGSEKYLNSILEQLKQQEGNN